MWPPEWSGPLAGWFWRLVENGTESIQGGLWLLAGLAVLYWGWELARGLWNRRERPAVLVALPGSNGSSGDRLELRSSETIIGRGDDAQVCLPDRSLALAHAVIGREQSGYRLRVLGDRDPIRLNGRRVPPRTVLQDGDLLELAGRPFRFHQKRAERRRPEIWVWLLALAAGVFSVLAQRAAWGTAGPGRPAEHALFAWSIGLAAGAVAALVVIRVRKGPVDPLLAPVGLALLGLGLSVLLRTRPDLYERQASAAALGLGVLALAAIVPLTRLARYRYLCLLGGLGLLLATLTLGRRVGDQSLAITVLGLQFQPAEPAKLLLAVFLAGLLSERQELVARMGRGWSMTRSDVRYLGPMVLAWGAALGLLIVQRDLGTALLFFGLFVAFIGLASGRAIFVVTSLTAFAFSAALSAAALERVRSRIDLWLDPWDDPRGLGYQLCQGLFALGAGGLRGVGLGRGFPDLVPAAHTDLPMTVIGEELGLIAGLGVLALLGILLARGYRAALRVDDEFLGLLAAGLTTAVALQVFVIVGGLLRVLPLTGVTLPFVSYGGSSLVTNMALLGILLGISTAPTIPQARRRGLAWRFSWRRQLRWAMAGAAAAILCLAGALAYWQLDRSQELTAHPSNPRLLILEPMLNRGKILSVYGSTISESVFKEGRYRRRVPTGSLFAGILGYSSQRHGRTGVEGTANRALLGAAEFRTIAEALERSEAGTPGDNVRLTLDMSLQMAAARALGSRRGSVVALDPRTGAVRAMVSFPRYSLHRPDERWESLVKDPRRPLLFRATHGVYPPGSTFKILTAAVALGAGVVKPETVFRCGGTASIGRYTWRCYGGQAHGALTLADAVRVSCNVTFGRVGYLLGREKLVAGARRFGFGRAAPMEIATGTGLLDPNPQPWRSIPVQLGFGQGPLAVTPLQMALLAAGIANDGMVMRPFVIRNYEKPDGTLYNRTEPRPWQRAVNPTAAGQVRSMMRRVVESGTGRGAQVAGVTVAGKTGTAENPHGQDHAWFIAFAPAEKPKLAVAVIVEGGGLGGRTAAPIARSVLAEYFTSRG